MLQTEGIFVSETGELINGNGGTLPFIDDLCHFYHPFVMIFGDGLSFVVSHVDGE